MSKSHYLFYNLKILIKCENNNNMTRRKFVKICVTMGRRHTAHLNSKRNEIKLMNLKIVLIALSTAQRRVAAAGFYI